MHGPLTAYTEATIPMASCYYVHGSRNEDKYPHVQDLGNCACDVNDCVLVRGWVILGREVCPAGGAASNKRRGSTGEEGS